MAVALFTCVPTVGLTVIVSVATSPSARPEIVKETSLPDWLPPEDRRYVTPLGSVSLIWTSVVDPVVLVTVKV